MADEPNVKGSASVKGIVKYCPSCGMDFVAEPLAGGVRVECASQEEGGCDKAFRVIYVA